jgi:hypothetical protein
MTRQTLAASGYQRYPITWLCLIIFEIAISWNTTGGAAASRMDYITIAIDIALREEIF